MERKSPVALNFIHPGFWPTRHAYLEMRGVFDTSGMPYPVQPTAILNDLSINKSRSAQESGCALINTGPTRSDSILRVSTTDSVLCPASPARRDARSRHTRSIEPGPLNGSGVRYYGYGAGLSEPRLEAIQHAQLIPEIPQVSNSRTGFRYLGYDGAPLPCPSPMALFRDQAWKYPWYRIRYLRYSTGNVDFLWNTRPIPVDNLWKRGPGFDTRGTSGFDT